MKGGVLFTGLVLFLSCNQATTKKADPARLADEMCGCLRPLQDSMSKRTVELVSRVSMADSPQKAIMEEMRKLDRQEMREIGTELQQYASLQDPNAPVRQCMENVQQKSKVNGGKEDEELNKAVLKQLENQKCTLAAAMMRLGLKMENNSKTNGTRSPS